MYADIQHLCRLTIQKKTTTKLSEIAPCQVRERSKVIWASYRQSQKLTYHHVHHICQLMCTFGNPITGLIHCVSLPRPMAS